METEALEWAGIVTFSQEMRSYIAELSVAREGAEAVSVVTVTVSWY